jgi:hypothetical protein
MIYSNLTLEKCSTISPQTVIDYLQNDQWKEIKAVPNRASTWEIQHPTEGALQVLLPLDPKIPDFSNRMHDLIQTIAFVEQRSESEIFNDLANVTEIAQTLGREVLNLHFYFGQNQLASEAPAKKLGNILSSLQDTIDAIGQAESGHAKPSGKISEEITDRTTLDILCTFKGSFGVRLAAAPTKQLELFEDPLAEKVMSDFIMLLKSSKNESELRELMMKLQQRAASRYRRFLLSLTDINAKLRVEWGSYNISKGGTATLSVEDAWYAIDICDEVEAAPPEQIEIIGELTAVNGEQKTFRIRDRHDGQTYYGKISDEVFESGVEPVVTKPYKTYKAIIQQTLEEKTTGESLMKNKLLYLEFIHTRKSNKEVGKKQLSQGKEVSLAS